MRAVLRHPLVKSHGTKFLRFAVCGGLGACVDFGTLYILIAGMGWQEEYALIVSTGLAMIFVFFANRFFTFRVQSSNAGRQAARFLMVYLIAAALNYGLSLLFIYMGVHYLLSKALAIGFVMFFNYFSLNGFVFKQKEVSEEILVA